MLSREHAREQLKSFALDDGRARRQARVQRLPDDWRRLVQPLIETSTGTSPQDRQKQAEALASAIRDLATLAPSERETIFDAFFPHLAPHIEQAWQLCATLPYHPSKAFRAPHLPDVHQATCLAWLQNLLFITQNYEQDLPWYATWASYLGWGHLQTTLGILFAAAINTGDQVGNQVFEILVASARGEHAIGSFGHHIPRALLTAHRPNGWEFIEKMLLAAQRQEGLRQAILESIDLAHPLAFRRMLHVILDHDLTRFSATIRALDAWLGFRWGVGNVKQVNQTLTQLLGLLEHPDSRERALASADPQTNYLALWTLAFEDVETAMPCAEKFLHDSRVEQRFVGTHLLAELRLTRAYRKILPLLRDADLRVATYVVSTLLTSPTVTLAESDVFDHLIPLIARFPKHPQTLEPRCGRGCNSPLSGRMSRVCLRLLWAIVHLKS